MTTPTANNLAELLTAIEDVVTSFGGFAPWWRGHAVSDWKLIPSIHHRGLSRNEWNLASRFRSMAYARHAKCPGQTDFPGWLFLMQHYGLPTRVLDWTESPLTALYFAVEDNSYDSQDAAIWSLRPTLLNKSQNSENTIPSAVNTDLRPLFQEAFSRAGSRTEKIVAVQADQVDIRQLAQQAAFTVHGHSRPINELPGAHEFLHLIRIDHAAKKDLRRFLRLMGITRAALFPDLGNLSHYLADLKFAEDA